LPPALGGDEEGDQLARLELDLREVVLVLRDHVALLGAPDVHVDELERHAVLPEDVLVPLEHALGGVGIALSVRLEHPADLFEGERLGRLEEESHEIQQAFQRFRAVPLPHGCGIISAP
jgi:hypothetical protein